MCQQQSLQGNCNECSLAFQAKQPRLLSQACMRETSIICLWAAQEMAIRRTPRPQGTRSKSKSTLAPLHHLPSHVFSQLSCYSAGLAGIEGFRFMKLASLSCVCNHSFLFLTQMLRLPLLWIMQHRLRPCLAKLPPARPADRMHQQVLHLSSAITLSDCLQPSMHEYAQVLLATLPCEIWKYCQSTSKAHAEVLQNLTVIAPQPPAAWPHVICKDHQGVSKVRA